RGALDEAWRVMREAEQLDSLSALEHRGLLVALPVVQPGEDVLRQTLTDLEAAALPSGSPTERSNLALAVHDPIHHHLREYLLGQLYARLGSYDRALEHADRCERLAPPDRGAALPRNLAAGIRARVAMERGDWADVLTQLESVRLGGWFEYALASPVYGLAQERYLRGLALHRLGRDDEARGWLEGLAQRSPYEIVYREPVQALLAGSRPTSSPSPNPGDS
ncbi:MAG: hypothetical protein OEZ42_10430, partial [Gemmatimonadota bacterium]|nr:hypothetical protein [Gemmatimonadota bacterium]